MRSTDGRYRSLKEAARFNVLCTRSVMSMTILRGKHAASVYRGPYSPARAERDVASLGSLTTTEATSVGIQGLGGWDDAGTAVSPDSVL